MVDSGGAGHCPAAPRALSASAFEALRKLMLQSSGINLAASKQNLVANRLLKRLRKLALTDFDAYVRYLSEHPDERQTAIDLLTTNETRFFREASHFELLGALGQSAQRDFRVWSAACSSGEEPYSMAMVLSEARGKRPWEILATDLSHSVLQRAERGIYDEAGADQIPGELLRKYCLKGVGEMAGYFQVKRSLRERVRFQPFNLNEIFPPELGLFAVVFLRNVLIYFDREAKKRIVSRVLRHLPVGGYLVIGHSESLHGLQLAVEAVRPSVYRKC